MVVQVRIRTAREGRCKYSYVRKTRPGRSLSIFFEASRIAKHCIEGIEGCLCWVQVHPMKRMEKAWSYNGYPIYSCRYHPRPPKPHRSVSSRPKPHRSPSSPEVYGNRIKKIHPKAFCLTIIHRSSNTVWGLQEYAYTQCQLLRKKHERTTYD